jgi:hypothetical protein
MFLMVSNNLEVFLKIWVPTVVPSRTATRVGVAHRLPYSATSLSNRQLVILRFGFASCCRCLALNGGLDYLIKYSHFWLFISVDLCMHIYSVVL